MKTKTFDCVEMKRRGAEHVYSIIKDMTAAEEIAYWRKRTQELREEQAGGVEGKASKATQK
jgi:hypothetical protein